MPEFKVHTYICILYIIFYFYLIYSIGSCAMYMQNRIPNYNNSEIHLHTVKAGDCSKFVLIFNKNFLYWCFFSYRSLQGYERLCDLKAIAALLADNKVFVQTSLGQHSVCFRFFA
jgi:hypothetical protein